MNGTIVGDYISYVARQSDLKGCWDGLTERLGKFGFDRILFGSRENLTPTTFHNFANTVILSTYGPELDKAFLDDRLYLQSPTVRWAVDNEGAISWGVTHQRYQDKLLSKAEAEVFEATRALGLTAGYTYSLPDRGLGTRSCFGLCFRQDGSQAEADAVWAASGGEIMQLLDVFEIAQSQFRHVQKGQELSRTACTILKLAGEGRTLPEIAELLGCHRRTVEDHLARVRSRLGAANTLQAVLMARKQGQI